MITHTHTHTHKLKEKKKKSKTNLNFVMRPATRLPIRSALSTPSRSSVVIKIEVRRCALLSQMENLL